MRPTSLHEFSAQAGFACLQTDQQTPTVIFVDDDQPDSLLCLAIAAEEESPDPAVVDRLFAGDHDYAAMAVIVSWSPNQETDFAPAWLLVAVHRGEPADFVVGRIPEQLWFRLSPDAVPWFAVSTAGSLREALDGKPLGPIRSARSGDQRLFGIPGLGDPAPPARDSEGRI